MPESDVDRSLVYVAYGELMHRIQVFDLTVVQLISWLGEPGASFTEKVDEIEELISKTLGRLIHKAKERHEFPDALVDDLDEMLSRRNYVAHHFRREYFMVVTSERVREQALVWLAETAARLESLEAALEDQLHRLGAPDISDLDPTLAKIDEMRPSDWPAHASPTDTAAVPPSSALT